ncbi:RhoGAP-domain-containing protein [Punctularia strigosozonata HHB-11173 SS5]|uniref:RhoGAP-domain-containing protein n=1 Tax=Punctularia strigosozonata (strain HHB-11173) TaxID=741275 RepID=UPI00044165B4|nr:RhoGAP-domain-containing protein [Punctularia strigosozonata HHB-11173 SS5]EIN11873.1 RhoGAP-domain-containing protein [Punctularia strigosozonata HHB-11173 SS5]
MLQSVPPRTSSSRSDTVTSDDGASFSSLKPPRSGSTPIPTSVSPSPATSSTSPSSMGQALSRPVPSPAAAGGAQPPAKGTTLAGGLTTGGKLKRAFAGRRKKSEDSTALFTQMQKSSKGREPSSSSQSEQALVSHSTPAAGIQETFQRQHKGAKQLTLQIASSTLHAIAGRKHPSAPPSVKSPSGRPPPLPPKPLNLQPKKAAVGPTSTQTEPRVPSMMFSPGSAPALQFIRDHTQPPQETEQSSIAAALQEMAADSNQPQAREREEDEAKQKQKEDWRKSDSTMTSHVTVRPRANAGNNTPRPVSIADSVHSVQTITPVNKRLSALITDAEFATPEEEEGKAEAEDVPHSASMGAIPRPRKDSPASSVKARNRRSISLNLGSTFGLRSKPSTPALTSAFEDADAGYFSEVPRSTSKPTSPGAAHRDPPTLSKAAATGIISSDPPSSASSGNIKGRLAAWTAAANASASSSKQGADRAAPPPVHPERMAAQTLQVPPSMRQTALSMTSGTAGFAMGLGRRAAEKVGRAWAGFGGSGSSPAQAATTPPGAAPSSYPSRPTFDDSLGRSHPNSSAPSAFAQLGKGKGRRTPNAPSATWSINSSGTSSSVSENEAFIPVPVGPILGPQLRGNVGLNAVFGRSLKACARDTPVVQRPGYKFEGRLGDLMLQLESRKLPALVVRCAQHILKWGVDEEGLFRISGRASHIAKLRAEFDTGADYDVSECTPGDLDPHAVASVFKAYLRELPEPILTHELLPYFDLAMSRETEARAQDAGSPTKLTAAGGKGPGLPTGPRGVPAPLRKPPSLSTLAMPTFSGVRPPSDSLLNALSSLVVRLPQENRDLLRTVVDLVRETTKQSKITKMPLSNLLLVLCPSMNMQPPLLKVLCETESLWDSPRIPSVIDIGRADQVIDIKPEAKESDSEEESRDATSAINDGEDRQGEEAVGSETLATTTISDDAMSEPASGTDDAASFNSASDSSLTTPPQSAKNESLCGTYVPLVASSEDSLPSPAREAIVEKVPVPSISYPAQPASPEVPPTPRGAVTNPMFQFPAIGGGPPSPKPSNGSVPPSPGGHGVRLKRPSLHLLFSKRSASPSGSSNPSSPYLTPSSGPRSSSMPSPSTMVTAPQPSTPALPPKLEMSISHSPIRLGMSLDAEGSPPPASPHAYASASMPALTRPDGNDSPWSRSRSGSLLSLSTDDEPQEDWARSVLMAADANVGGESAGWRVKQVVQAFESHA